MAAPKTTKPSTRAGDAPAPEKPPAEPGEQAPHEPKEVGGVWTTAVEGVYSATKGGPPDPTVQPLTPQEAE